MTSIVMGVEHTAYGKEHYHVWGIKPNERRERWFTGNYLKATQVGGPDCEGCAMTRWCLAG